MTASLYSPEVWLVLDAPVWQALQGDRDGPSSLFELRLDYGLVESASIEQASQRLAALAARGLHRVHLVVERLDAGLLRRLRTLWNERIRVQVYDWYRSPLDVSASLDAPDAAIADRLRNRDWASPLTIWPPPGAFAEHARFRGRLRMALEQWERDARAEHGAGFRRLYGEAVPWLQLIPESPLDVGSPPGVVARLFDLIRAVAVKAPASPAFGMVLAMSEGDFGIPPLNWTYQVEGGGVLALRVELPSRAGANVEVSAALGPGTQSPAGFCLADETGTPIVSALTPRWVATGMPDAPLALVQTFADEFGELRARFLGLRVQPELQLLAGLPVE